jgi:methylglutaconyl-CoA hydratase
MEYTTLDIRIDDRRVAYVALNRPEKRNALSAEMIAELTHLARHLEARVMVLSGAGVVFCAGGDLAWMRAQIEADRQTRMAEARKLAQMLRALNEMPMPVIGRLHGAAMGGGVGLACICDVALASDETTFGLTETRLGLIPATISPYVIARMGEGRARQVFMSGAVFDATKAERLGIVSAVLAPADLDAAVEAEIAPYLRAGPKAVAASKALAQRLGPQIDEATISYTIEQLANAWEGDEARDGIEAFFSKSPAPWAE